MDRNDALLPLVRREPTQGLNRETRNPHPNGLPGAGMERDPRTHPSMEDAAVRLTDPWECPIDMDPEEWRGDYGNERPGTSEP